VITAGASDPDPRHRWCLRAVPGEDYRRSRRRPNSSSPQQPSRWGAVSISCWLAHVASLFIAAGAVVAERVAGLAAPSLRPAWPVPENLRVTTPRGQLGRARLYAVPLFGVALLAVSGGTTSFDCGSASASAVFAAGARREGLLWPAEACAAVRLARVRLDPRRRRGTDAKRRCEACGHCRCADGRGCSASRWLMVRPAPLTAIRLPTRPTGSGAECSRSRDRTLRARRAPT